MFLVFIKQQYEDMYRKTECENLADVTEVLRSNYGQPGEILVAIPVEWESKIVVKITAPKELPIPRPQILPEQQTKDEGAKVETTETKPEDDQSPGAKGPGAVRRGSAKPV